MSLAATREGAPLDHPTSWGAEPKSKRILIVDARRDVFDGLSDVMARAGGRWAIAHAADGEQALAALGEEPADVIVVDEQLAPMDGVTLLTRVRDKYPTTIRMILSTSAGSARPSVAAIVAHRLLGKPCNIDELSVMIRRSCELHTLTDQAEAVRKTMAATTLPSRPGVYTELNQVLSDPTWQPSQVAAAVERDVAMSAKVLQLANSALFGLTHTVSSVKAAVVYLGVDTIKSLALTAEAFGKLAVKNVDGFSINEFQNHAMLVARITSAILPAGRTQQEAVTAALLHDIGKLVLISDGGRRWAQLNEQAIARKLPMHETEQELDGITHAEIGAYLLSLWGLPDTIVEAVAHHHRAGKVEGWALDAIAAVHIADALAHEVLPSAEGGPPDATVDEALLERLGLRPRLDLWRHQARQLADAGATSEGISR